MSVGTEIEDEVTLPQPQKIMYPKRGKSLIVAELFRKAGKFGLTEDELEQNFGHKNKNISSLIHNHVLRRTTVQRETVCKRMATVLIHTDFIEDFYRTDVEEIENFKIRKKGDGGTLVERKDALDRWYTHEAVAQRLFTTFLSFAKDVDLYIEPSAGSGSFFNLFPLGKRKGYDILPSKSASSEIQKADFFDISVNDHVGDGIVAYVGNPPFGKMATSAISFFKECAKNPRTKYIAFIVPKTFQKVSVQNTLPLNFRLIHEENLPFNSFTLFCEEKGVPSCFQIWMRTKFSQRKLVRAPENIWFDEVEKDVAVNATDGVYFAIRRAGGLAGEVLDGLNHSVESTLFLKEKIDGVRDALHEMNFLDVAEKTAGTRSLSKTEIVLFLSTITLGQ